VSLYGERRFEVDGRERTNRYRWHRERECWLRERRKGTRGVIQSRGLLLQIAWEGRAECATLRWNPYENHEQARTALFGCDAGLSITKIYTVSFVCQARLYLRIAEEFGNRGCGRDVLRAKSVIRTDKSLENKISRRDEKFAG